jgi:hypothetical protein
VFANCLERLRRVVDDHEAGTLVGQRLEAVRCHLTSCCREWEEAWVRFAKASTGVDAQGGKSCPDC